jgi:pimeloyl-ACP methyl ester carboxylesterase
MRMPSKAPTPDLVVLIPGLWMPAWAMLPLAWRLRSQGYRCVRFGYASSRGGLEANADRLAGFLRTLGDRPLHLVGHSLGGVLALHTMATRRPARVRRMVMIGSPAVDTYAGRRLMQWGWGRWMVGRTVPDWLERPRPVAPDGVAVGVIAGVRAFGLGMIVVPDLPRPHDGVIRVQETAVAGAADYIEVDVSHAAMLTSLRVARLVADFVGSGRFAAGGEALQGGTGAGRKAVAPEGKGRAG